MKKSRIQPAGKSFHLTRMGWLAGFYLFGLLQAGAQDAEYARKVVEELASPSMYGRGFVFNGAGKAARYLTRCFKEYNTEPVNGKYHQTFRLDVNTFPRPVMLSVDGILLDPATDYLPDPASPGIKGSFGVIEIRSADFTSGNFLIKMGKATTNHLLYLNFPDLDSLDPGLKKEILAFRVQMMKVAPTQASGIIEVTGEKLSWSSSPVTCSKPWISLSNALTIDSLSNLEIRIKNKFISGKKANNIMGILKGTLKPDSFIAFTAHYDHLGAIGRKIIFPGANDNASGIAMLLSLMKYYAAHPPKYSMLFLATSAEELGLLGSAYFVRNSPVDLKKIRFLINFDLVGTGEEGIMVVNAGKYPAEFKILTVFNKEDTLISVIKSRGEACNSDHCPFYQWGVPCFYIYTLGGSREYHNLNDSPGAISLVAFENYKKLIVRFVEGL